MKRKFAMCSVCGKETIHSISRRTSPTKSKKKRDVDRCDECQTTIISGGRTGNKTYKYGRRN